MPETVLTMEFALLYSSKLTVFCGWRGVRLPLPEGLALSPTFPTPCKSRFKLNFVLLGTGVAVGIGVLVGIGVGEFVGNGVGVLVGVGEGGIGESK